MNEPQTPVTIIVCVGKSCTKDGARNILKLLQEYQSEDLTLLTKYCFGKCGNGPVVVILPEVKWYYGLSSQQVTALLKNINPNLST
jgi:NADH:ubiquinone oxidoreductase subunit E